jgi:uroporphyrinogen III methyltransferase/synthase
MDGLPRMVGKGNRPGTVYLVGAGPGDPGLLTLRGAELLSRAQIVVHDRLSGTAILALAPPGAELVDVGKWPDSRGDQAAINDLLISKAKEGLTVVRLKGGDPFVFGRGGEEALALQAAGIPFEVVPGVSSAIAAPAFAGVPVTHRGLATSFTVVAGHWRSVELPPEQGGTNWEALAAAGGTIVVLMGAAHSAALSERLLAGGLAPSTPVVAVRWATEPCQEVVRTTLAELPSARLQPPVVIVIGDVAGLDLSWEPTRPLAGKSVVVTGAKRSSEELSAELRELGARVIEAPAISIEGPSDGGRGLASAASRLAEGAYQWVAFTSANAVERFLGLVPDARALAGTKVAAVGPATAAALRRYRLIADLIPGGQSAHALAAAFPAPAAPLAGAQSSPGQGPSPTVLLPQAAGARPELLTGLVERGWQVEVVEAYRTLPRQIPLRVLTAAGEADAICFASPSAVYSYVDQAQAAGARLPPIVACIGPSTATAAALRGIKVDVQAQEHSAGGLASALKGALAKS